MWILYNYPLDDYFNTEISHEQLFFDDGSNENIGFGGHGPIKNEPNKGYRHDKKYYDDKLMRKAKKNVKKGKCKLLWGFRKGKKNNCQDWADRVRGEYKKLYDKLKPEAKAKIDQETKKIEAKWKKDGK